MGCLAPGFDITFITAAYNGKQEYKNNKNMGGDRTIAEGTSGKIKISHYSTPKKTAGDKVKALSNGTGSEIIADSIILTMLT
jgi:hypothetical protein